MSNDVNNDFNQGYGTRAQHLAWAKGRAIEILDRGDWQQAFTSLASDLSKHPETAGHIGLALGMMEMLAGTIQGAEQMRRHIEGYN